MEEGSSIDILIRSFDYDKDYVELTDWWKRHGSFAPDKEHLPKTGLLGYHIESGEKVCAGFLYNTDSSICVFEFFIVNPDISKEIRDAGLDKLINRIIELATQKEYSLIYTSVGVPKFIDRLESKGFVKAEINQQHMFKSLRR